MMYVMHVMPHKPPLLLLQETAAQGCLVLIVAAATLSPFVSQIRLLLCSFQLLTAVRV